MSDPSRTVIPGQPLRISADAYNSFVESARAYRQGGRGFNAKSPILASSQTLAYVKNTTETDLSPYDVLAITGILFDPNDNTPVAFRDAPAFSGHAPSTTAANAGDWGALAVAQDFIPAGGVGLCCIEGVTIARVHVRHTLHRYAGLKQGDVTQLESRGHGPARILFGFGTTGESQLSVIRLGGGDDRQILIGRTVSAIDVDTAGSVVIWHLDSTGTKGNEAASSQTVTAFNRFGDVDANTWVAVASVGLGKYDNEYDLIAARCVPMVTTTTTTTTTAAPTTTTTAAPTTTTTAAPTTTTTSTTTTSTTTTATGCTVNPCTWTWNGFAWVKTVDCAVGCVCPTPVGSGLFVGQTTNTPCIGV